MQGFNDETFLLQPLETTMAMVGMMLDRLVRMHCSDVHTVSMDRRPKPNFLYCTELRGFCFTQRHILTHTLCLA